MDRVVAANAQAQSYGHAAECQIYTKMGHSGREAAEVGRDVQWHLIVFGVTEGRERREIG
jgi:hypothetical protein